MNPAAILPFFSTMLGGFAALRLRHRLHAFMALAAGVVVATAVADLLPEPFELAGPGGSLAIGAAAVLGFVGFSLVEAFLHQSSFEHAGKGSNGGHEHDHDDAGNGHASAPPVPIAGQPSRLLGVLPPISLIVHSTLDGLAIGLGFAANADVGLLVLFDVMVHDFADGLNVVTLAFAGGRSQRSALVLLALDAAAPVLGIVISQLIAVDARTLGLLLGVFGGAFIAIGASHLLPEAQHREQANVSPLVALTVLGALVVLGIRLIIG